MARAHGAGAQLPATAGPGTEQGLVRAVTPACAGGVGIPELDS
jgi:hypothetical protein